MLNLATFKANWDQQFPDIPLHRTHFVLAVSGGVDSVVLAHLMHSVKAKCTIAHVNFQLRGSESNRDESFVRLLANQLSMTIQVHICETEKYAATYKMGIQQAAREIRYAWFGAIMEELSQNEKQVVLLTAHHADDQVETIFMQLCRGTGIHGLTGIPPRRKDILNVARPLLQFSKSDIKSYAAANTLDYVEDSSNEKNDYTRNLIRNQVLPQLATIFPTLTENIIATSQRVNEAELIVNETVEAFWKKGLQIKKGIPSIPVQHWNKVKGNATYTWGLIKKYGFKPQQIEEVLKIVDASQGAYIASHSHKLIHWNGFIQLVSTATAKEYVIITENEILSNPNSTRSIDTANGTLTFELIQNTPDVMIDKSPQFAYLDASKIGWPMCYRTWEPTDYFYPLGLRKKKKLAHFLGSLKLSPSHKAQVTILSTGDRIAWVVCKRIDDRFKITPSTQKLLKITWEESK